MRVQEFYIHGKNVLVTIEDQNVDIRIEGAYNEKEYEALEAYLLNEGITDALLAGKEDFGEITSQQLFDKEALPTGNTPECLGQKDQIIVFYRDGTKEVYPAEKTKLISFDSSHGDVTLSYQKSPLELHGVLAVKSQN